MYVDKHFNNFTDLIKEQLSYGAVKYASKQTDREATDILFDKHGKNWLIGTIDKYCFRFSNVARERDILKIACYSDDTEIMTENGWKLLKDVVENKEKVKIATLNPEKDVVEYYYPVNYIKQYRNEKLFSQKNSYIDLLVTQEHNLYVKPLRSLSPFYKNDGKFCLIPANKTPKHVKYKRNFPYHFKFNKRYFLLPRYEKISFEKGGYKIIRIKEEKKIPINLWVKFLGIWLAEGHVGEGKFNKSVVSLCQSQKANPDKCKLIEELMSKLPFKYGSYVDKKGNRGWRITDMQLWTYMRQFGKSHQKFIPTELLNSLSFKNAKALLEWLILGDGHIYSKTCISYCTVSKRLADNMQELGLKCGYTVNFFSRLPKKEHHHKLYVLSLYKNTHAEITVNTKKDYRKLVDYKNFVYCVEVPNHIIYVRRNGKSCWCGNCYQYIMWLKRGFFVKDLGLAEALNTNIKIKEEKYEEFVEKATKLYMFSKSKLEQIEKPMVTISGELGQWSIGEFKGISESSIFTIFCLSYIVWFNNFRNTEKRDTDTYNSSDRQPDENNIV